MMDTREVSDEEIKELLQRQAALALLPQRPPSPPEFEAETWPPIWKAKVEESPEYRYMLIQPYLKLEESIQRHGGAPEASDPKIHENNMLIINFLRLVRESRGYDIDIDFCPPEFDSYPLQPMPFKELMEDDGYRHHLHGLAAHVVAKMNARAKMYGQVYEFVEYEKVVRAGGFRLQLVTFWVKEVSTKKKKLVQAMVGSYPGNGGFKLFDMRFKPEAEAEAEAEASPDQVGSSGGGAPLCS